MNKAQLIAAVAADINLQKVVVESVLESAGRVIAQHFAEADAGIDAEATLPGLGKLKTTMRAARSGRNPATGEAIEIPERMAVKFSAGKALENWINP
ncbi:MAG: HU family DNA-binding protein [Thauera sp.]|jgi:DNA-binding protein HU-beta|nr:HU family DNA-binding protein [Thauera sp.]